MPNVTRHHPLLVALHWILAFGIIVSLARSLFWLAHMSNADPAELVALRLHMTAGMVISTVMLIRLIVRLRTSKPPATTTGFAALDPFATITHYSFYALVFGMAGTGLARLFWLAFFPSYTAIRALLFRTLSSSIRRASPTKSLDGPWAALIGVHVLAVLFHQFVKKDGALRRMWFGRRLVQVSGGN